MERELNKNCSQIEQNGFYSGACSNKAIKLFGVTILSEDDEEMMRKSASMGNLASRNGSEQSASEDHGYQSEDLVQSSGKENNHRMKAPGVPWTQEEHMTFLVGLERLGKGDWKGISRKFVKTKNPIQVASHAQKYFLKKTTSKNKNRKPSIFDMEINNNVSTSEATPISSPMDSNNIPEHNHDNYLSGCVAKNEGAIGTSGIPPTFSPVPASSTFASPSNAMPLFIPDSSAFTPSFLQISLNSSPQPTPYLPLQATAVPSLMENCNVELTIAPSSAT